MTKLSKENKFLDFSDYGRIPARWLAKSLINTKITPVHISILFFITGLIGIYCILNSFYFVAFLMLILKSTIDAADGELARLRKRPSYVGRYLDSNLDLILNFCILFSIHFATKSSFLLMILAFFSMQLQGTVFNYYYTILRNNIKGGDTTSRIEEKSFPKALFGENQKIVNVLFIFYTIFYGIFDYIILSLDKKAKKCKKFPSWFMSFVSIYGLGFQLLIIGSMLLLGWIHYILPFFIGYSIFVIILIEIRKNVFKID